MYYKVTSENNVIDVLKELVYVRYQERNSIVITTKIKERAMGILSSDQSKIYHTNTMVEFPKNNRGQFLVDFINVDIHEITKEDYDLLYEALKDVNENEDGEGYIPDTPINDEIIEDNSLDLVKSSKINKMSAECNNVITSGVDVTLTDGLTHHFDLTVEDQLNIITLKGMVEQGMKEIPYHATDEVCKFYSAEDILLLVEASSNWKIYHVSYFNSLKNYINALTTIQEVKDVYYGIEIPEEYQSDVLKQLLQTKK